jgi:uncharacterized DUF497 family protein
MVTTCDETKRRRTLAERGLDFADAEKIFAGNRFTRPSMTGATWRAGAGHGRLSRRPMGHHLDTA